MSLNPHAGPVPLEGDDEYAGVGVFDGALSARDIELLVGTAADAVLTYTPDGVLRWVSPSIESLTGWKPHDLVGKRFLLPDPAAQAALSSARKAAAAGHGPDRFEQTTLVPHSDGSLHWMHLKVLLVRNEEGKPGYFLSSMRDVDAAVQAEQALAASEEHYRLLAENSSDIVFRTSADSIVLWTSPSVKSVLGWDPEDLKGVSILEFLHPEDRETVLAASATTLEGERVEFEARYHTSEGQYRWLQITARPILDENGKVIGKVGSCRDVHEEVLAKQSSSKFERLFSLAMASAPSGMAVVDLDRRFISVNPALASLLEMAEESLLACRIPDIVHPEDDNEDLRMRAEVLSGHSTSATGLMRLRRLDGSVLWVQHGIGLLRDDSGVPLYYVSQFVDVTAQKKAQDELVHLAGHDPLTGLANRRALVDWMETVLAHPPRSGAAFAVLYLDVDGLKPVNDTYGHSAGDELISTVAERIKRVVREEDITCRLGGDEFVVALPEVASAEQALVLANKIKDRIAQPMRIAGKDMSVTASIGVALSEPGESPARILQRADLALYQAKSTGRNKATAFEPVFDSIRD